MGKLELKGKLLELGRKYRYAILIVLIGMGLMLLPGTSKSEQAKEEKVPESTYVQQPDISERLAQILSKVQGAGKVEIMLTVAQGEKYIYQRDETISSGDSGTSKWDTVIITDEDRAQQAIIQQVNPPVYQGALIVCQGAENASVRLAIVDAVSKMTGLGADKISVVKMKS